MLCTLLVVEIETIIALSFSVRKKERNKTDEKSPVDNKPLKNLTIKYLEQFATKFAKLSSCVSLWGEVTLPKELRNSTTHN